MAADPLTAAPGRTRQDAPSQQPSDLRAARRRVRRRRALVPYLYIAPAIVVFITFTGLPFLHSVWLSFFKWDGITIGTWIGLENYSTIATNPVISKSFVQAGVLVLFFTTIPIAVGLLIASLFRTVAKRGGTTFRVLIFMPVVLSSVVIGVIWTWIYASDGPLNEFLRSIGLGAVTKAWLGDFTWALPAIGMVGAWTGIGMAMVLFVAGIQQIDGTLYDAARVDGAGRFREFLAVTLPALRLELGIATTLGVVGAINTFDTVFVMTRGGPGTETQVPGLQLYNRAFLDGRVGQACAIGVVLAVLSLIITVGIDRFAARGQE